MTPASRHRIRNLIPGGLGLARCLSVTEAPHNIKSLRVSGGGGETFCFFETHSGSGVRTRDLQTGSWPLTTAPGPPPYRINKNYYRKVMFNILYSGYLNSE